MSLDGIKRRGFASQTAERRREIARKGGLAAQVQGKSHRFSLLKPRLLEEKMD